MTTALPSQPPIFTPEQRRMLGQVYNLILSWRKEKKNPEQTSVTAVDNQPEEIQQPGCIQNVGSHD
jgi:hypothetical protein